ncbi:hypothetical protein MKS88_002634 [Plasmodium brasilianum]|uniref:Uncharacterized protein n=1 Tax=Plasmodium brasilianum TaxID=5824 RepID=A0ACB9YA22_PLABR|nr:hypothetical protein MKS88_002634 [Plasmodium brasilianum]
MIQTNKFFFFIKICPFPILIWIYQNSHETNTYGISYIKKIDLSNSLYVRVDRLLNEERGLHPPNGSIPLKKMSEKKFKVSSDTSNNNNNYEGRLRTLKGISLKKKKNTLLSISKSKNKIDKICNRKMEKVIEAEYKGLNNFRGAFSRKFLGYVLVLTPIIFMSTAPMVLEMLRIGEILTKSHCELAYLTLVPIFILAVLIISYNLLKNIFKYNNKK